MKRKARSCLTGILALFGCCALYADVAVSPSGGRVTLPDGTVFETSYTTIKDGLSHITAGGTIWIDDGEYVFTGQLFFFNQNQHGITFRGVHGATKTILKYDDPYKGYFFYPHQLDPAPSFVGLTFRNGYWGGTQAGGAACVYNMCKDVRDCVFEYNSTTNTTSYGATCIYAPSSSGCVISNCIFRGNGFRSNGIVCGGAGAMRLGPFAKIVDCVFEGNRSKGASSAMGVVTVGTNALLSGCHFITNQVGAGSVVGANTRISKCTFISNTNTLSGIYTIGAGIMATGNDVMVVDSFFSNNVAGCQVCFATQNDKGYHVFVSNCTFAANVATGHKAAAISTTGQAEVYDSVFVGNRVENANSSATIHVGANSILRNLLVANNYGKTEPAGIKLGTGACLENVTVVGNRKDGGGVAGVQSDGGKGTLRNVVFADNRNNTGLGHVYCPASHYYNCHFDASPTTYLTGDSTYTTGDPKFVDAAHGDYHFQRKSPLRDAGTNETWMAGAKDLDGRPRVVRDIVDIGCYEYQLLGLRLLIR